MNRTYYLSFLLISTILLACNIKQKRYLKGQCPRTYCRSTPFLLRVNNHSCSNDTLFLDLSLINMSNNSELLYKHFMKNVMVRNDTTLLSYQTAVRQSISPLKKYNSKGKQIINCENCFEYYSKDSNIVLLKRYDTYNFRGKYTIKNLGSKPVGYQFNINPYVNLSYVIYMNCPRIWGGTVHGLEYTVQK